MRTKTRLLSSPALLALSFLGGGCAHPQATPPAVAPSAAANADSSVAPAPSASAASGATPPVTGTGPLLSILLRPVASPAPVVHVEIDLDPRDAAEALKKFDLGVWRLSSGAPEKIAHASAHDAKGDIAIQAAAQKDGYAIDLTLAHPPSGALHLAYDVVAGDDAPDDPLGLLVLDDRFRGAGEKLIALPALFEDTAMAVVLKIDGEPLRAEKAASSLGVGAVRKATIRPRALRYSAFLLGSLGVQVIDASEGHDEAAWLGYTAFDPRPVVAELAQVRTSLGEFFSGQGGDAAPAYTYLLMARSRANGPFATTARFNSALLQVEPGAPWNGPVRLSMAQQLARQWVGDALRLTLPPGHEWELDWFNDGVARYVATQVLAHSGLLPPRDWHEAIAGELSVLATSPYASQGNAALAALAGKDPVARATLMARGALYAARESAVIAAKTKGEKKLQSVLVALIKEAATENGHTKPLPASAWLEALAKEDPDAQKSFEAIITKGGAVTLPPNALGPCFRAGTGEYVAFDAGFDVDATRIEKDGKVVGVREGGPAAKAGLKNGDVLESMNAREDDANVPVKIVVSRGGQKVNVTYVPRGAHGKGQVWTRVKGVADEKCGDPP